MTGDSYNWNYNRKILGAVMLISGVALMLEHLFTFNGFDLELIGHEYYGLALIIGAFLFNLKWKQLPGFIAAFKSWNWKKILDEGER